MEFLGELLALLDAKMDTPTMYGWFHLLFFALSVAAGMMLCKFAKPTDSFVTKLLLTTAILSIGLEVYKQINYTFSYDGQTITADFQWYAFPFQFCSTPMYVGLLAGLLRKGKVRDGLVTYLATYALFGGLVVMIYPAQVFISTIGINIQTMICHGSMIVVGAYLLYTGYVKLAWKTILKAMPVFAVAVCMAVMMNEIAYMSGLLKTETFNMFFVSRHCESTLPIYGAVHEAVPFPLNLVIYILGFTAAASVILLLAMGIRKIGSKSKKQLVNA